MHAVGLDASIIKPQMVDAAPTDLMSFAECGFSQKRKITLNFDIEQLTEKQ